MKRTKGKDNKQKLQVDFEAIHARLMAEVQKIGAPVEPAKPTKVRPPRSVITVRLSCKKADPAAWPEIIQTEKETLSELEAELAAYKEARSKGYQEKECILLSTIKETK